jgi:lipid A ethanolaminephosphotransferase
VAQHAELHSGDSGRFHWSPSTTTFVVVAAGLNTALYNLPLFSFGAHDLDLSTLGGILTLATLPLVVFLGSTVLLALLALVSHRILKPICILTALGNAVALYFLITYRLVLDSAMIGNVFNTDFSEASEFLHPTLIGYVLALGILPSWLLTRVQLKPSSRVRILVMASACCGITLIWAYLAASSWLWIDNNSKRLGGMVLPWTYLVNAVRYELPRIFAPGVQALLPVATFASQEKTVVILVIGEAARAKNFALYGYGRPTNPLLSNAGVVALKSTSSCATYTTASVRCILSNVESNSTFSKQYEPLPSYLQRSGVDVIWRTHNFGEPPLKVQTYQKATDLSTHCAGTGCEHDEVLLSGLEQRIAGSTSQRIFVVLHQSSSHGPAYYTKYPSTFEKFKPVCKSVELSKCSEQELINAYDNTILYEDYFLFQTIGVLKRLQHTSAALIYVSDHGESLGEYGVYLHGVPYSIAPDVQKVIPFIVWMSDEFVRQKGIEAKNLESQASHSQRDIFHSVMGAFSMRSDAYLAEYDIFSRKFGRR